MGKLALYYHYRNDGGTRTTVDVDGVTVLHHFQAGKGEADPTLAWFIDVRCEGVRLPVAPAAALQWLRDKGELIRSGITEFAGHVTSGVEEADVEPLRWEIAGAPRGVRITLVAWAQTRKDLLRIPRILGEIRDHWEEILGEVEHTLTAAS